MKANELRIGNYVFSIIADDIIRISAILENQDLQIQPIPLTEEWLLKFGYTKISNSSFMNSGHGIWICNNLFMCDKNGINLKHVHQLQNLYFALTGEELEIK